MWQVVYSSNSSARVVDRDILIQACYSSWKHQNVLQLEEALLVTWDKKECGIVCLEVLDLSVGEDRAPEAGWASTAIRGSSVKVGVRHDELCAWFVTNP